MHDDALEASQRREPPSARRWHSRPALALAGVITLGAGVAVGLAGIAGPTAASPRPANAVGATGGAAGAKVSVTGTGVVSGRPDELTLQIGATTSAPTATSALDRNSAEVAALEAVLRAAGVGAAGMQTSGLNLGASYDANGDVSGYQASDQLTVTLRGLRRAGSVIDAAAHAVGSDVQINGISFSIADTSSLLAVARLRAMRAAATAAETYARAAGTTLGPVLSVTEQSAQQPPVFAANDAIARAAAGALVPVPVQAGREQVSVGVAAVYELQRGRS